MFVLYGIGMCLGFVGCLFLVKVSMYETVSSMRPTCEEMNKS